MFSKICIRIVLLAILPFLFLNSIVSQESFPDSWQGKYKGELHIFGIDSIQMKVDMGLDIIKKTDSTYQWKMTYVFREIEDIRNYQLVVVDRDKGIYGIDEQNSIFIDSYYRNGVFTSMFKVEGSYIISSYQKVEDELIFDLISADGENPKSTGNSQVEETLIPEVLSFLVNARQRAVLQRED
jgi:hypothetical protein